MDSKNIPDHYHHYEGGMREDVDDLLEKHKVLPLCVVCRSCSHAKPAESMYVR